MTLFKNTSRQQRRAAHSGSAPLGLLACVAAVAWLVPACSNSGYGQQKRQPKGPESNAAKVPPPQMGNVG